MTEEQRQALFGPLEFVKGVGPARSKILNRIGIRRPVDLLFYFPRSYQDLTLVRKISELEEGPLQTVEAVIEMAQMIPTRRGMIVKMTFSDGSPLPLEAVWFNQGWIYSQYAPNRKALIIGQPVETERGWSMTHPKVIWENSGETDDETPLLEKFQPFLPIYPLTEGLHQYHLQKIIQGLLPTLPDFLDDVFPEDFRARHHLLPLAEAIRKIHFPQTAEDQEQARYRFVYQELLILQLALGIRRRQHEILLKAEPFPISEAISTRIRRLFPYDLTDAQNKVIGEIAADLGRPVPMNRLLQGDVGSGKTLVAAAAMLQVAAHRHQAVLMAPTEILARQHLRTFTRLLENSRTTIVSLFGAQKAGERAEALQKIEDGTADIIIGTQAIICNDIHFARLGLVVIDEQHKFGVMQRARLKTESGFDPHYLVMTATPIPRSISMTLFGDLDLSVIDSLPPGRQPVRTYVVDSDRRAAWWDFFRKKIREGRQGYVIAPRVEESEDEEELKSVKAVFEELKQTELSSFRLGILHGRMTAEEKEKVMLDFRTREIEILVSTTVVEVGVDVPNATLMTIENGDRFGLAQLHQLRGRIGRGKYPGFCAVFRTEKSAEGEESAAETPEVSLDLPKNSRKKKTAEEPAPPKKTPLEVFAESNDGFYLAEQDLAFRGPGELFGTRQHGIGVFHLADLVRDQETLLTARDDAKAMLDDDLGLSAEKNLPLRAQVLKKYGAVLDLGDVG